LNAARQGSSSVSEQRKPVNATPESAVVSKTGFDGTGKAFIVA
jgi:hypothetical protein